MNPRAVFLLERDNLVREALLDILEQDGYAVYPLDNPWEAASFSKKINFQIAIIDSSAGDFDIKDLIREFRQIKPSPCGYSDDA